LGVVQIVFRRAADRALSRLPASRRRQIVNHIERLVTGSASRNLDIRPLAGVSGLFRLRVGDYRVVYSINEAADTLTIELIRGRGDVYKR
jgi:mRNA interferase RelE/StbE